MANHLEVNDRFNENIKTLSVVRFNCSYRSPKGLTIFRYTLKVVEHTILCLYFVLLDENILRGIAANDL